MKTKRPDLIETWRKLQTSDHFYYMCTKWSNDGDVHAYFSPYQSPYDAYIAFMNALSDLQLRVSQAVAEREEKLKAKQSTDSPPEGGQSAEEKVPTEKEVEPEPVVVLPPLAPRRWWEKIIDTIPFFKSPRRGGVSS